MNRIVPGILLLVVLLGLTGFTFAQQIGARITGEPSWELLAIRDARATPETAEKARRLLTQQPLDQAKLNLLFATEAKGELVPERRKRFRNALYSLGWRDTSTQQNLIVEAGLDNDARAAILHIDALLRRGKLTDQILPILQQIELVPEATALLAERLEKIPLWRERYLTTAIRDTDSAAARARLFNRLLDDGDKLSHTELKPSLDAMIREGLRKDAVDIAIRANPEKPDAGLIYDPDFSKFVASSARDRNSPLPFEWNTQSRPGISAQIVPQGQSGQLRIRWNGNGAPVIARTLALMNAGQKARLEVAVDSADALNELHKFRFSLACSGQPSVPLQLMEQDANQNIARYSADDSVSCDYPDLIMRGQPQNRSSTVVTSIDAIRLFAT